MEPVDILEKAVFQLKSLLTEIRRASFYETEPVPKSDQRNFINTAVTGFFDGSPGELLRGINEIETMLGRDRSREIRWGERSLDIDILLFGDLVISMPALEIPHPRLAQRRFALEPLLELWPEALSPKTGAPYRDICAALPDQGVKVLRNI